MLKRCVAILIALSLAPVAEARPRPPAAMRQRITRDFVDADLTEVLKFLGEAMGREVRLWPGIDGKLTVSLRSVPPAAALHEILRSSRPDLICVQLWNNTLIVAPEEPGEYEHYPPRRRGVVRQEILLERAPAAKVIGVLQATGMSNLFRTRPSTASMRWGSAPTFCRSRKTC